jgi:DNA-directed RNA polymerase specialized sigma24 family protein
MSTPTQSDELTVKMLGEFERAYNMLFLAEGTGNVCKAQTALLAFMIGARRTVQSTFIAARKGIESPWQQERKAPLETWLLTMVTGNPHYFILKQDHKAQWWTQDAQKSSPPTHWLPLPAPPASDGEKTGDDEARAQLVREFNTWMPPASPSPSKEAPVMEDNPPKWGAPDASQEPLDVAGLMADLEGFKASLVAHHWPHTTIDRCLAALESLQKEREVLKDYYAQLVKSQTTIARLRADI